MGEGATLHVDSITVRYGSAIGIDRFSLTVPAGAITMLVGPNGAGKSSILRAIAGFPVRGEGVLARGRIMLDGRDLRRKAPHTRARQGLRFIPERKKVFGLMTVEENLSVFAGRSLRPEELQEVWGYFPPLFERRLAKAGTLSGGERQMLALTPAALVPAKLLLVDEMTLGLSPAAIAKICPLLTQLRRERGFSLLMAEQSQVVSEIADDVVVLADHAGQRS